MLAQASAKAIHDPLSEIRREQQCFSEALARVCLSAGPNSEEPSAIMREHLRAAFERHKVYALKGCLQEGQWSTFRVVNVQASANMTLQRASHISKDAASDEEYSFPGFVCEAPSNESYE